MRTVSEKIAQWVRDTDYNNIPQEIVHTAKRSILDFIGCALAGSVQLEGQIVKKYITEVKAAKRSSVIGLGFKTSCTEAAFANGIIGHCLDYDDLLRPVAGAGAPHVSTVILPAALAIAERYNSTGKQLITAYVLGCEITYRVGRGVDPTHYNSGWHSTGTEGVFGAVVATGKLLGLDREQFAYALGIAGSEAAGLHENFGTMTKPFHAGQAAANGTKASLLAQLGFTSSKSIFEGKSGFCNVLARDPKLDEITKNMGQPFSLSQICLKFYPCCAGSHSAIYAALELAREHDIAAGDIEKAEVKCDPQVLHVVTYENPKTALQGKFSMQFPIALALLEREVTLSGFTDEKVRDSGIIAMMRRIKVTPTPELRQTDPMGRSQVVEIKLRDGRHLRKRCDFSPGTPRNPLSDQDLWEKYRDCARLVLPQKETEESIELIMNLESIDNIGRLLRLVS